VIATVQAFFLKHLIFVKKVKIHNHQQVYAQQDECLAAAITDILMNASNGGDKIVLVLPAGLINRANISPSQCQKMTFNAGQVNAVFTSVS